MDAECRVRTASAVRTAVVRDRQESEQVCRMLLQELSRHELARCREHSQVTKHCSTAAFFSFAQKCLSFFDLNTYES